MDEDLQIGDFRVVKREKEVLIDISGKHGGWTLLSNKDAEKLKSWLEEATKPRFQVKYDPVGYLVVDTENKYSVANFKECEHINAEKEATLLCERLNQGE